MAIKDVVDIYYPNWSKGVAVSAAVLGDAIAQISGGRITCRPINVSTQFYNEEDRKGPVPAALKDVGAAAIFIERIFARSFLDGYRSRVYLPNPEWLTEGLVETANEVADIIIYRSQYYFDNIREKFPRASHHLIGFTSPDPGKTVQDYAKFSHFRGKATTRHTQALLDIWQRRPDFPPLSVQAFGADIAVRARRWLTDGNISLFLDFHRSDDRYFSDIARGGIHLCTSGVEGFGHYINESRAMAALILTLDAPPMNELITCDTGLLIPTTGGAPMNSGINFTTSEELIEQAVETALSLSPVERRDMGRRARRAYEVDRQAFLDRLRAFVGNELGLDV